jgi:CIC family chloride channel protein
MFVLEELQENCASVVFFVAAVACLGADMMCRKLLGQSPIFPLSVSAAPSLYLLPAIIPLGVVCGLLGVAFNKTMLAGQRLVILPTGRRFGYWIFWGLVIGLTAWWHPELLGGGQHLAKRLLLGESMPQAAIAAIFIMRFFLTIGSYSTGVAGGILSPVLVMGALVGLGVADLTVQLIPVLAQDKLAFIVAGMAALFTGVVRAPLTGMVLVIEMTANYELVLPLFLACFVALAVADGMKDLPIYEALLERDLKRQEK